MISPASFDLRTPPFDRLRASAPVDGGHVRPIGPINPNIESVAPADAAAVAAAVRGAFEHQQAVYPVGGGTSLDYGPPRTQSGIALSLAALDRVLDHPAEDLTVTVEAGTTLAELNHLLAEKRQWLPLDAPEPERATLGGIIATNACGPRRHGCGTIGDYLIGFRAIDGRGEEFRGGGKVVKNAAGYNLPRLMVGSLGTLGVIVEATFMVRPLPGYSALLIRDVAGFQQTEELLAGLGQSRAMPTIVELLAGPARPNCPLPAMQEAAAARLVIGFEGSPIDVPAMLAELGEEWSAGGAEGVTTIAGAGVASIWNWLSASPAALQINVLPSRLAGVVEQLAKLLPGNPLQAHASSGVVLVYPPVDGLTGLAEHFADLVRKKLRPLASAAGGHLTVLAAPEGAGLTAADIWGPPRAGAALMRSIQQRFDPAGILNPGRSWL
jgi:glycolate oxidase FAD binding subunit